MSTPTDTAPGARVLVSEAEPALRSRLRRALEAQGLVVEDLPGAVQALAAFRACLPDLVLLGADPEGTDTADVCASLRALPRGREPAIVLLVSPESLGGLRASLEAGADDFLALPAGEGAVAERVRIVLARRATADAARRARAHECESCTQVKSAQLSRTGVLNLRKDFLSRVEDALTTAQARGRQAALLCLDLRQVRSLAGALSHEASVLLMREVDRRLGDGVRGSDQLARLGCDPLDVSIARLSSDELSVLLSDLAGEPDAVAVARRALEIVSEPFSVDGQEVFLTVGVGVAVQSGLGQGAEQLLKSAQTAAYCARQEGRSSVVAYTPGMDSKAFQRLTLESGLRRALERDEFLVHYQPRVEISTGAVIGFEALIRWRHPDLGLVSPAQFIPIAEETGLIVPIGEWILAQACEQGRAWQDAGLAPVRISVNLSAVQFRQPDLFEVVERTLERARLEPRWLELELTESLLMHDPEQAVQTLRRLSDHGIHLSIDDFGTGYSSLSYLKRFPIDSLKIDRSFIRELTTNPDDAAIATSVILMGKSLKLRVVAEGVETRSQLSFLRVMQCHEAQGYLFSPPVPAAEAERLLRQGGSLLEAA